MSRISEFEMFSGSGEDRMLSQRGWWPCPPAAMRCKQTRTGEMEKGMMAQRAIHDGIAKKRRYFLGQRTENQYPPGFFFCSVDKTLVYSRSNLAHCSKCLAE